MGNTSSEAPAMDDATHSSDGGGRREPESTPADDACDSTTSMAVDPAREDPDGATPQAPVSDEAGRGTSVCVSIVDDNHGVEMIEDAARCDTLSSTLSNPDSVELESCSSIPFTFELVLHCESAATTKAEVKFATRPSTVVDVKRVIQEEFKVPVGCQKIFLDSTLLRDKEQLKFYRIRNGDTLHVHYNSEADVEDICDVIAYMELMVFFIDLIQPTLNAEMCTAAIHRRITENVHPEKVESLAVKYFYPCSDERAKANRLLFVQSGGLDLLYRLHEGLLKQPWCRTPIEMQYLEHALLRVLWNFTAAFSVRTLLLSRPTLSLLFKSFNRVKIPHNAHITAPLNNPFVPSSVSTFEHDRISSEVIYKALGTICNLAELPECRVEIASNKEFMEQVIATMVTVAYKYIARQVALAGLLCLAYSPETHVYLTEPSMIEGIQEACVKRQSWYPASEDTTRLDNLLLRYFGVMFFSQMVCSSCDRLSVTQKQLIRGFIQSFLNEATHQEIREHEVKSGYIWSTLVPFAKLAFTPSNPRRMIPNQTQDDPEPKDEDRKPTLEMLCAEAGVFSLQNVLSGNEGRDILIAEGLLDYVTCLPWNIPEGSKAHVRAKQLVSHLSVEMQLQPPSLVTMVKAKLAVMHFGLVKVVETRSVHQLLAEVYQ